MAPEDNRLLCRIAITGSRYEKEFYRRKVLGILDTNFVGIDEKYRVVFKHGDATGVDAWGKHYAKLRGWETVEFEAEWAKFGKAAGPIRNGKMLQSGVDILLAFPAPNSIGTWDCIKQAVALKIQTRIWPL